MFGKRMFICLVLLALLIAPVAQATHHEGGIKALAAAWEAAYNSGDMKALVAMYMEDGMRLPADRPMVQGHEAILGQLEAGVEMGLAKVKIETVEEKVMGDMAIGRGTFTGMDTEGNTITTGKWSNVLKMVDGEWKVYYDIFNYDAPMIAPE